MIIVHALSWLQLVTVRNQVSEWQERGEGEARERRSSQGGNLRQLLWREGEEMYKDGRGVTGKVSRRRAAVETPCG